MSSITEGSTIVSSAELMRLREDVSVLANSVERMQLEQSVLLRLLPNLVDMAASLKVLKGRFKDLNVRVSGLDLLHNEVRELQKRVDAMGLIIYTPRPPAPSSPAPGIYT